MKKSKIYDLFKTLHIELRLVSVELHEINLLLKDLTKMEISEMAGLENLTEQVQVNTDTEASAIVLLNGLSAQLASIANDPAAVAALAAQLKASSENLAAAIVANTPAAAG